jgi:broad specificity phosphatase PhoE
VSEEPTSITFVRHGQSLSNQARRWEGHGDSPLSELGRRQAHLLGLRLRGGRFTHAVASDLERAVETARASGLPFEALAEFREIDVGLWEGLSGDEVAARFPRELEALSNGEDVRRGGGESYAMFCARVDAAVAALRARLAPGDRALVVCHGGFIATALDRALSLGPPRQWALSRAANTSITELSYSSAGAQLRVFNDTWHLLSEGAWPPFPEAPGMVGLVCEGCAEGGFGAFEARYDATEPAKALATDATDASSAAWIEALSARLGELHERHPAQRVALAAQAASIHAWAEHALWRGERREATLAAPLQGSITHVGRAGGRPLLLDYGVGTLLAGPA